MNGESTAGGAGGSSAGLTPLEALLARALEQRERGETIDLAALCANRPELLASVEAALARLPDLHEVQLAAVADPALDAHVGARYRLRERIGAGAMGVVYSAVDTRLDREVAVKVLRRELLVGARMDQRLAREGKALARIRHPNVVTVHDSGQCDDGRSFVVMEKLRGCSLGQVLAAFGDDDREPSVQRRLAVFRAALGERLVVGGSDVRLVVDWLRQAADGVHAAHAAGVVHRDVKPSNLFLETSGKVVVLDFGIVSVDAVASVGGDGSPIGTPAYMAPEQIASGATATPSSDVYGLAATLYHLLTGRPPFAGTIQQVLHAVSRQEPVRADRVRPGLPSDLVAVVEKGMAKEPARRYPSAAAFRDDLAAWLEHRPVTARRASWVVSTGRRLLRSPSARWLAATVLVTALVLGARQWIDHRDGERRARVEQLWAGVPPSLVNELPDHRATNALRRDPEVARLLDALVELADEPTIPLALRVLHASDCGDLAAAAADARRIAAAEPAPFTRAALARFEAGELADDLAHVEQAPAFGGPGDRCLLVLHAMRRDGPCPRWVETVLETDAGLQRHALFAELHLLLRQRRAAAAGTPAEQLREHEAIERATIQLEGRRGTTSGIACHLATNALIYQGRMAEAHAMAQRGCELAPGDYVFWLLAGSTALRCGEASVAATRLHRARAMQPRSRQAGIMLSDALLALEQFAEARQAVAATPFAPTTDGDAQRAYQLGLVALAEFYAQRRDAGSGDSVSAAAARATLESAATSFAAARNGSDQVTSIAEALCASLLDPDFSRRDLLTLLAESPLDGRSLEQVALLLPKSLGVEETAAVAVLLRAQAQALGARDR